MKINKSIMSVDDNPLYLDFWPLVSKVWKLRFNIEPVLIYFGNQNVSTEYGTVIRIRPLNNVDLYLQTQWARMFFTSKDEESTFITSDIDMFPISRNFFADQVASINENKYVHLYGLHRPIPMCYNIAKGKTFKKILDLPDSFEESMKQLLDNNFKGQHMGYNRWGIDEYYLTSKIEQYNDKNDLVLLKNDVSSRLDRSNWPSSYEVDDYIDCHSLRPVNGFKEQILDLTNRLCK